MTDVIYRKIIGWVKLRNICGPAYAPQDAFYVLRLRYKGRYFNLFTCGLEDLLRKCEKLIEPMTWRLYASKIWNTRDLIVSMDGLSFMCPPEIREGYIAPWPHVDQPAACGKDFVSESPLKTGPYTIQGQLLLEDSFDGDGNRGML